MSRKYDQEFKIEAVKLAEESNNASLIERNLNIGSGCIHRWRKELQNNNSPNAKETQINNIKLKQLERENKRLRIERDILSRAYLYNGTRSIFGFIREYRTVWSVVKMCSLLSVFRSGFYKWSNRQKWECNLF